VENNMADNAKKVIIDVNSGNITGEYSKDKATLVGVYPYKDIPYADNIELVLDPEDGESISISFPYSGYNMQLFVGDFTGDNKSEIMVRGGFGGSGGFEIAVIYKYEAKKLIEIFNQDQVNRNNPCTAKYKDNYLVAFNEGDNMKVITIDAVGKVLNQNSFSLKGEVPHEMHIFVNEDKVYLTYLLTGKEAEDLKVITLDESLKVKENLQKKT